MPLSQTCAALGFQSCTRKFSDADSTRLWMKPRSFTAALTFAVGAPWEINRLAVPVSPESNRTWVFGLYSESTTHGNQKS